MATSAQVGQAVAKFCTGYSVGNYRFNLEKFRALPAL
jgi:hypothetical protein